MSFDLSAIVIFTIAALLYSVAPSHWRGWLMFLGSLVAVYWLQSFLSIRYLDYVLPTATIVLTVIIWWFTRNPDDPEQDATWREDRVSFALIAVIVLGMASMRFIQQDYRLTASRPPDPIMVALVLAGIGGITTGIWRLTRPINRWNVLTGLILLVIGLFVLLKTEGLAVGASRFLRGQTGQDTALARMNDLAWIGFSYVAFRLIHTLRDRQSGKLPALSLREFTTYVIFFPAYTAGPIDRAERFAKDYRTLTDMRGLDAPRYTEGLTRIMVGIFKKFVIADTLAISLALNPTNAEMVQSTPWLWMLLYGYALRLFFDFSGYTDIAIGIGILFGIHLPENFNRPYLRHDLASFWQSWHITLSNWARFYVFTPLSRVLLTRKPKPSPIVVVLVTQLATMIVIGLWHGVTVNFIIWGAWHGLGLFVHKQWSDRTRKWYISLKDKPVQQRAWTFTGWFITFHFVVIGWVWFAIPEFEQSVQVFGKLFGMNI